MSDESKEGQATQTYSGHCPRCGGEHEGLRRPLRRIGLDDVPGSATAAASGLDQADAMSTDAGPTERPSPPSKDCGCGARPTSSHNRFCPEYTTEDHAWCLKQWSDARSDLPLGWIDALRFAKQQKPALC